MKELGRREKYPIIPEEGEIPLGSKIRALRWYRNMPITVLAKVAGGVDDSFIGNIELGKEKLPPERLPMIAVALQTTPEELQSATRDEVLQWLKMGPPNRGRDRILRRFDDSSPILSASTTIRISGEFSLQTPHGDIFLNVLDARITGEAATLERLFEHFLPKQK